ncbi:hypothetical protein PWT90_01973 [Aphanocladium album]|nr:hypothetical protein PWT90_01973 [Aphanocladium album]
MESRHEHQDLLLQPEPTTLYDTGILYCRYLKNRVVSVSRAIKSTGAAASSLASPRRTLSPTNPSTTIYGGSSSSPTNKSSRNDSATAYLSGIRGVAAVIVFIFHATWAYSSLVDDGYGLHGGNRRLIQLPFIRLVHAGHAMVGIFFLIGGYVNAVKPIKLIRAQRFADLAPAVGSSLLRRVFRLYLPAFAATLTTALLTYVGFFEPARSNINDLEGIFHWPDYHPGRQPTLLGTLSDWRQQMLLLVDPWKQPFWTHLDPHLWTVTVEFRASLVVSLCLAAVACCRVVPRLCILTVVNMFMLRCDRWEISLFLTGATLAELDLIRRERSKAAASPLTALGIKEEEEQHYDVETKRDDETQPRPPAAAEHRMLQGLWILLLALAGMYLMSSPPAHADETPGYVWISRLLVPSWTEDAKRYVHGAGAVLFLIAVSSSALLQRPFLTSTAQYLGTISYSLYIVHGPVLHGVGYVVTPVVLGLTGTEKDREWATGLVLSNVFIFVVVLGVADVFYRFVESESKGNDGGEGTGGSTSSSVGSLGGSLGDGGGSGGLAGGRCGAGCRVVPDRGGAVRGRAGGGSGGGGRAVAAGGRARVGAGDEAGGAARGAGGRGGRRGASGDGDGGRAGRGEGGAQVLAQVLGLGEVGGAALGVEAFTGEGLDLGLLLLAAEARDVGQLAAGVGDGLVDAAKLWGDMLAEMLRDDAPRSRGPVDGCLQTYSARGDAGEVLGGGQADEREESESSLHCECGDDS